MSGRRKGRFELGKDGSSQNTFFVLQCSLSVVYHQRINLLPRAQASLFGKVRCARTGSEKKVDVLPPSHQSPHYMFSNPYRRNATVAGDKADKPVCSDKKVERVVRCV